MTAFVNRAGSPQVSAAQLDYMMDVSAGRNSYSSSPCVLVVQSGSPCSRCLASRFPNSARFKRNDRRNDYDLVSILRMRPGRD